MQESERSQQSRQSQQAKPSEIHMNHLKGSGEVTLNRSQPFEPIHEQSDLHMQADQPSVQPLTHFDEQGRARMVDVSDKAHTKRSATAQTTVTMATATLQLIKAGQIGKGDVLGVAQVAGIMAAKKTSDLIPMCHPLPITGVTVAFSDNGTNQLYIEATVRSTGQTGVEMEALTAVSAAALTVYDMCKAVQKDMEIGPTRLLAKSGGKSGDFIRAD